MRRGGNYHNGGYQPKGPKPTPPSGPAEVKRNSFQYQRLQGYLEHATITIGKALDWEKIIKAKDQSALREQIDLIIDLAIELKGML